MNILAAIKKISETHTDLNSQEAAEVFDEIMSGEISEALIASFLVALKMKGVCIAELAGAASAVRKRAEFINTGGRRAIDTCGTGGDGKDTFNISTTSAFIAAGAGACVAKHGGRAVSGKCGSADVLAQLGVDIDAHPAVMEHCLQEHGIAFLFAAKMHPAWKYAMPVRKLLGFRTVFNMLGPLVNPAGVRGQVLGVYDAKLTELFAETLKRLGSKRALVVHSGDGMDEISVSAPTRISELKNGNVKTYEFRPESIIGATYPESDLKGGDAKTNAARMLGVLDNSDKSGGREICLINAAAALISAELAENFHTAYAMAKESLDSGKALEKLNRLIEFSQSNKDR